VNLSPEKICRFYFRRRKRSVRTDAILIGWQVGQEYAEVSKRTCFFQKSSLVEKGSEEGKENEARGCNPDGSPSGFTSKPAQKSRCDIPKDKFRQGGKAMREMIPKIFLIFGLIIAVPGGAQAIKLEELFNDESIIAGDKVFDSWYLGSYDTSDTRILNASNIDITPLNDGGLNPGPGLDFSVSNGELSVTGNGIYNFVDLMFGFRVSAIDPLLGIKDVSLELVGFLIYSLDESNNLGFSVTETIGTSQGANDLATNFAEYSVLTDEVGENFVDNAVNSVDFSPFSEIWVTKNILVWAVDETDTAVMQGFEQRFSQEVIPEPSTVVLMLLGLVGLVAVGRRKLK